MAIEITINQNDIQYAKSFLTQYLADNMPEADFSEGSGLQDLVVKAMAYSFGFLRAELTKFKTLRSLAQLQNLEDDEEVQEAVDDIISNFFISRGEGAKSQVVVTITLSRASDIFIGTNVPFNRDGTHVFFAPEIYSINDEDLIETVTPQGVTTYETDIVLEAENIGVDYNIPTGNFISWGSFNPYVISVRNDQYASGGAEIESNSEYIERSNDAITVRNLINQRSTKVVLLDEFKDQGMKDVTVTGYGDPEMLRDAVNTNVSWTKVDIVHIGNHEDVYVNLPMIEDQTFSGETTTEVYLGEPDRAGVLQFPNNPVYKIHSVTDTITGENLPYTVYVRDHRYFYSADQEAFIFLNSREVGRNITVLYDTVNGFNLVDTYLKDPDERIILANVLAKSVVPIYVEVEFVYQQISGQPDLEVDAAIQTVVEYINSLGSNAELSVDSLLKIVHSSYGQYIIVKAPLSLKGTVIYPNYTTQEFYSENILTVPEYLNLGVTNRICGYFTSSRYIKFTLA